MNLRGNLFVKIFLGFWLVTVAIIASWTLTNEYFDTRPVDPGERHLHGRGPPQGFILRTIYELQNLEDAELAAAVDAIGKKQKVDIYLLDRDGEDLLDRRVPERVAAAAAELGGRRRALVRGPEGPMAVHEIYRRDQGRIRAVFAFRGPQHRLLRMLGDNPLLRVGLAVFISGLVCYGLSRLLTRRLDALRSASRRLAEGELDTRIRVREHGGDETDELARDFNAMAGQLQERIDAQKRLLSDVSHELRSPLARLRIALALAQTREADAASYLARIEREAERLEDLIGQLLSSQTPDIAFDSHIDLVALLRGLCADAGFEGEATGRRICFESSVERAIVHSGGDLLRRCFDNILRNALLHTAAGTEVRVELDSDGEQARVVVRDRGPGVPEAELERIFGEFYRVDSARARASGGYGLGLSIARRAVLQHGGEIVARNTGDGLEIRVTLPLHPP